MANGLAVTPLGPQGGFNWIYLVEILVCGILALFFLFYFNRLFATVLAYCIRAWTWHKYRAYIDINALQISLLGGRIFFKKIRYHAHNITVLVHDGHITWRYWLRLVQEAEIFEHPVVNPNGANHSSSEDDEKNSSDEKTKPRSRSIGKEENAGEKPKKELPCRISVKVAGIEAFVYNRSPAYDMILEQTLRKAQTPPSSSSDAVREEQLPSSSGSDGEKRQNTFGLAPKKTDTNLTAGLSSLGQSQSHGGYKKPEIPAFLRMLPVRVECKRAAAAIGNENTTSVIAAKLEKAAGTIDAAHAGPYDLYKLLFNFDLEKINVVMKPNRDFKQPQLDAAQRILRERNAEPSKPQKVGDKIARRFQKGWQSFTSTFTSARSGGSVRAASIASDADATILPDHAPGVAQWRGLTRYLDDEEPNEHDEWRDVEYAKAATLADVQNVGMRFYFDIPWKVPDRLTDSEAVLSAGYEDDINGSKPPEYGLDFAVRGGVVTYGPWADRQRINLQQAFFPASYVDAVPANPLKPGETRNWTLFKIFVFVEEDVVLRIPAREGSKDDKWQGRAEKVKLASKPDNDNVKRKGKHGRRHRRNMFRRNKQGNPGLDARPYGWVDVTVKADSTVNYTMDMFPRVRGYRNTLDVDVKGTEIASSVNHGLLWRTGPVSVEADLSQPITWNTLRKWPFNIDINDLELFILRDHFFLIIDLVNDWSSGAPSDFFTFVPYFYTLRMLFRNFIIYLNVNDANIVNDPAEFDKNDFLTLEGTLDSTLDISMEHYRPVRNWITFEVLATNMSMRMLSPSRSTFHVFMKDQVVAELPRLTLSGSYSGHLEERAGLTDTLRFDIGGSGLVLKAYGFLVRQLVNVKENYFGDYMHFKTLEEFQSADDDLAVANVKTASIPKPKSINELDVMLCIWVEDTTVLLPTNMYSTEEFVRAELPQANLDLRILSYYLDMGLQLSPLSFLRGTASTDDDSPVDSASNTQLFIKHVDLDGHRAFGLPPDEPSYVNQWDIDVGAITGELSSSFIHDLALGVRNFAFSFSDRENALPLDSPSVFHDIAFVQVKTDILRIWLHAGKDALLLSADPVTVGVNDWAGDTFSQRISVLAPKVTFACVDGRNAYRHRSADDRRTPVKTYAFLQTGVAVNVVGRKSHFANERQKQQAHIRENDRRTNRIPFLRHGNVSLPLMKKADFEPPAMPYPPFPAPLDRTGRERQQPPSVRSVPSVGGGNHMRTKSSSSSLSASIHGAASAVPPAVKRLNGQDAGQDSGSSQSLRSSSSISSLESSMQQRTRPADQHRGQFGLAPSTMAFSSPFSAPYFPLDTVEPDERNVPDYAPVLLSDGLKSGNSSISEEIDDPDIDHETAKTSVFIRLVPGLRVYLEPRVGVTTAKVLRKILPKQPEEVMDAFQMDVLGSVAANEGAQHDAGSTLELNIHLPAAELRAALPQTKESADDRLDISIRNVDTLVRVSKPAAASPVQDHTAVHATVESLGASLGQSNRTSPDDAAIRASVDDILLWVVVGAGQSIHASVRDTILNVSGGQAEYLADLALKILPIADEIKSKIDTTLESNRRRLLLLVYTLIQNSEDIGDPPFLSRMSYILRAFPQHFRNEESWKVTMRLRYILQQMPVKVLDDLRIKSKTAEFAYPSDELERMLRDWGQWRNWDVPNIDRIVAFQMLLKPDTASVVASPNEVPLTLTVRSEYLRLAVEAGKSVSEIIVEDTTLGLDRTPPTAPTGLMLVEENTRTKTLLQTHINSIAFSADWSLLSLAERVLPLKDKLQQLTFTSVEVDTRNRTQRLQDELNRQVFHIVASFDNASIALQTINLRHLSRAEGLKLSLIGSSLVDEHYGPCASAIVNADAAITELHGPSRRLWQTLLTSPSLYVDQVIPLTDTPSSVTVAIAYKDLRLSLLEQIPGLLHIVDMLIVDEVSKVMNFVALVNAEPEKPVTPTSPETQKKSSVSTTLAPKIHVALLAGELHVDVSLIETVKYQLTGTAGSVRIAPSMTKDKAWGIDFDFGSQNHCFVNTSPTQRLEQSVLDVPPLSGHVGFEMLEVVTSLSVTATMDRVEVDATAVQGIFSELSRPEMQDVMSAIDSSVEEIRSHVEDLRPSRSPIEQQAKPSSKPVAFDVRFALLGVRVATTTPLGQSKAKAEIEFGIGPLHTTASNRKTMATTNSLIPEVRAQVRDIGARLQIHNNGKIYPCGNATLGIKFHFNSSLDERGKLVRELTVQSQNLDLNAYADTASTAIDVINSLQDRIKSLDLSREIEYIRQLRGSRRRRIRHDDKEERAREENEAPPEAIFSAADLLAVSTTVQLGNIQIAWLVDPSFAPSQHAQVADLILSIERLELTTHGGHEARLTITDLQLQLAKKQAKVKKRSLNSAILPEMSFSVAYWSMANKRSFAFKAAGKLLEIRLESRFIFPVNVVQRSIESAVKKFKLATATWQSTPTTTGMPRAQIFDIKKLGSLLVEAEFAGAQVYMEGSGGQNPTLSSLASNSQQQGSQHGRYGQFAAEGKLMQAILKAPGIALKVEYNAYERRPTVRGEVRVDASSNMVLPNIVPLLLEVSESVKEVLENQDKSTTPKPLPASEAKPPQRFFEDESIVTADPTAIFGKTKVDLGLRICRQDFGLTCQPIARVDAKALLDDLYVTVNTIESDEHGHFFAISAVITKLNAQVKHMYSREPTFSFDMDSIVLSLLNSKHLSGTSGLSAILKINPTRTFINAKQLQDLLLFREIWLPPELRVSQPAAPAAPQPSRPDDFLVQKYQSVASAAAFPWNATVSIAELAVDLDLGQSIGKSSFTIVNLWASQAKSSNWEQNLCIGMDQMAMKSTGRMSGFISLDGLGVRTSIKWPQDATAVRKTPLIQASIGFDRLRAKAAFDYQAFAFGDIEGFDFLMYNVREPHGNADRLVAVLDCEKAYVFCTSTSPAQAVGLYQAFERLIREKQTAYMQSLRDIEKHLRRESTVVPTRFGPVIPNSPVLERPQAKAGISLHTDVVLTIGAISFGVFPSTFFDSQILKLEANTIQARFAVSIERGRIHSALGMTLGQLLVALASVRRVTAVPKALDISVDDVVNSAVNAKGGIILRVPKVVASMQTWQAPESNNVDYIFKSLFDGKIDVGWNLSRINFIKNMWMAHSRSLASRLGKALPESAVKITAGPTTTQEEAGKTDAATQEKITAEVNLPQSRYEYNALEPAIIETPQLRDMGEATPPLEWIGLHRDRLPNVTHQIIIVSLLEVAKEVEDAYERILGSK